MSDAVTVKINLGQFRRELADLGLKVERRVTTNAVRAAARVYRDAAKGGAPRLRKPDPRRIAGALAAAVSIFRARNAQRGTVTYSVGVRASKAAKGRGADPFYWRFLEAGWTPRGRGQALTGGRNRKSLERSRARAAGGRFVQYPFLAPAFQRSSSAALAAFERRFDSDLAALNAQT
jgi:HK97 gp10 family phage protein